MAEPRHPVPTCESHPPPSFQYRWFSFSSLSRSLSLFCESKQELTRLSIRAAISNGFCNPLIYWQFPFSLLSFNNHLNRLGKNGRNKDLQVSGLFWLEMRRIKNELLKNSRPYCCRDNWKGSQLVLCYSQKPRNCFRLLHGKEDERGRTLEILS